eukprot:COSAG04_NODE_370_length_15729_cov_5.743506_7_plen_83_part_00
MEHHIRARDALRKERRHPADAARQRDSGLKQTVRNLGDPEVKAKQLKDSFDKLPLPSAIKQVGDAGLYGLELGTKLGKWLAK